MFWAFSRTLKVMYKRILLKLSGEQLQGEKEKGFDPTRAAWIADQIKPVLQSGTQIVIMVGGGNIIRGNEIAHPDIQMITAHNTGMVGTIINALLLADVLSAHGVPARALGVIEANQVIDQFTHRRAITHLNKERVVIIGGGSGRPYVSTDTAALTFSLELNCDVVIKTTKVDGVYDKDPIKNKDAKKFDTVSYDEAVRNSEIAVMDNAALGLAMDKRKPIIICELLKDGNIAKAVRGERVGTLISS